MVVPYDAQSRQHISDPFFLSIIGSYGWGGKTVETLAGMVGNLKAEVLEPVLCKGMPTEAVYAALDRLADTIAAKHREQGLR